MSRVLAIVDDHPIVIEGIKKLLTNEQWITVHCFNHGRDFLNFLTQHKVDIVLLDLVLVDIQGIEMCEKIKKIAPQTIVLALSNQIEQSMIMQMLKSGASGYLLKNVSSEELLNGIKMALNGESALSREVEEIINSPLQTEPKDIPSLSRRETEILKLIGEGYSTTNIAEKLFISYLTVETHRKSIIQKFSANNMFSVVKMAMEYKIIG